MDWIKRNILFVIGSVVALALMGGAGFYLYQNYSKRTEKKQSLDESYARLQQLTGMSPGPGDGKKVDNIAAAQNYRTDLLEFIQKAGGYFVPIAPIPNVSNVTASGFAAELRNTIGQLQLAATNASVQLPPGYDFSFGVIKQLIRFQPGSLQPLSVQLGEVKAICNVLFKAKINSLDSLRRERVSPDDTDFADYIEEHSETNELAVLTPYVVTFRSFSSELAVVLSGFANSPNCFVVKSVDVASGDLAATTVSGETPASPYAPTPFAPPGAAQPRGNNPVLDRYNDQTQNILDEQPLRVTLRLVVVKPINAPE